MDSAAFAPHSSTNTKKCSPSMLPTTLAVEKVRQLHLGSEHQPAGVHAAGLHDRDGARELLNEKLPRLAVVWVASAHTGRFRE